jgi:hypothetical protein
MHGWDCRAAGSGNSSRRVGGPERFSAAIDTSCDMIDHDRGRLLHVYSDDMALMGVEILQNVNQKFIY